MADFAGVEPEVVGVGKGCDEVAGVVAADVGLAVVVGVAVGGVVGVAGVTEAGAAGTGVGEA
ncbi:hypothetical protein IQ266_26750, partial [filamentous cyanobacterium LEGE 11480]